LAQSDLASSWSGNDSTQVIGLDSIAVFSRSNSPNEQLIAQVFLKTNPIQTYAELLQKQSGVFIRSKGYGALSTPSFKGLGTMHLPIMIYGVNMQSSMNGTMDLSLIDAVHFKNTIFGIPNGRMLGSPSLGDGVAIGSNLTPQGCDLNLSYSSIDELGVSSKYSFRKKRFNYALSASLVNSKNKVSLKPYNMDSFITNSDFQRVSLVQNMTFDMNPRSTFRSMLYYLNADRGIPPSFGESHQNRQQDENLVHVLSFNSRLSNKSRLTVSNQLSHEKIIFFSSVNDIQTSSYVNNINTNVGLTRQLSKKSHLLINVQNQQAYYYSDALVNRVNWSRLIGSYELTHAFNIGSIKFVQGFVNWNADWAMNARLSGKIRWNNLYTIKGSLQKVYRLPVLNELYWYQPGEALGNRSLKPEDGYKLDIGFARSTKQFEVQLNPHISFYQNWIQWGGFPEISPENISQVSIGGAVLNASYSYPLNGHKLIVRSNVHYVRSVYQFDDINDLRHNKQLIFTPRFTSNLTLSLVNEDFGLFSNVQYVGKNFVTSDNSSFINPYYLVDVGGYYSFSKFRWGCSITNIINTPYYTQPRTPLPGRIIKLTLNYKIKTQL
jgi:iron complex outermembrane receptor protein